MANQDFLNEINKRRTFAIISHPDAGKTTITEKVLLFGNALQKAGTVKGKKSGQHAKSDWMEMEKERGISVTTSVMQFPYADCLVNLLDTPGHEDFSEDTYRTLTAVDSCLMVIDSAKGVEARTVKLMEVTRLRDTPIITFMNKIDRDIRDPIDLMDEVEEVLKIACAPITWPIGMGKELKGVYHILRDEVIMYNVGQGHMIQDSRVIKGLHNPEVDEALGVYAEQLREEMELVEAAANQFDHDLFMAGELTPVYFGTALGNFGVDHMLDGLTEWAPGPQTRQANEREVEATEEKLKKMEIIHPNIENIKPEDHDKLKQELSSITGVNIQYFTIIKTDLILKTAEIKIFYKNHKRVWETVGSDNFKNRFDAPDKSAICNLYVINIYFDNLRCFQIARIVSIAEKISHPMISFGIGAASPAA